LWAESVDHALNAGDGKLDRDWSWSEHQETTVETAGLKGDLLHLRPATQPIAMRQPAWRW
jgi:hypothetical protein